MIRIYKKFEPIKRITGSEWAEKYFYLSPESSATTGRWRSYPYQVGILNALTDPEIEIITWMKSSRVGYTKLIDIAIAYYAEHDVCSQLVVQPTIDDAEGFSKEEIAPMIRDVPVLQGIFAESKTRDSHNTILKKHYPGGILSIIGANSPRGFRRITARNVYFDEIDGYPPTAGQEGDQIQLGIRRTDTYWNRKIIHGSTPTVADISRIEKLYNESDKRRYFVPCPGCNKKQYLKWAYIRWPKNEPDKAYYECEYCHKRIEHHEKKWMVENGEWVAEKQFSGHAGFHIWAAYSYSPNAAWSKLANEFLTAIKNNETLKTFINTRLGEVWEEQGDQPEAQVLYKRREVYAAEVPEGGLVLTCSVDVQDDRLEIDVKAHGLGRESWGIEKTVIYGDLVKDAPWKQLDEYLQTEYRHEWGIKMRISCTAIDSGGHYTDQVYKFCKGKQGRRIFAIKGANTPGAPLISKPSRSNKMKIPLYSIGTDTAKEILYARLKIEEPGPGYMHFPMEYQEEYFDQLTAEKAVTKYKRGFPFRVWIKTRPRNEALDLTVYNMAALDILNPNMDRIRRFLENKRGDEIQEKQDEESPLIKQRQQKLRRPKKQTWMAGLNNRA